MKKERDVPRPDEELKRALQTAVATPSSTVDWDRMYDRIMAEARSRLADARPQTWDYMASWSSHGIPLGTAALVAAIITLWSLPLAELGGEPSPAGFWPVAEELISGLPEDTRQLLNAGTELEDLLTALAQRGVEER